METVLKTYKKTINDNSTNVDVLGVIRTLFPDISVETFIEKRAKKKRIKNGDNQNSKLNKSQVS